MTCCPEFEQSECFGQCIDSPEQRPLCTPGERERRAREVCHATALRLIELAPAALDALAAAHARLDPWYVRLWRWVAA